MAVAFVDVHDNVDDPPCAIDVGLAFNVHVGIGWAVTVMTREHVLVPPGPVAVAVYVVVAVGDTLREPPATGVTEPMP